jgi:2-hydroxy-3-keto-5-methylthiopentenyl-1-phosphate phosphatase
MYKATLIVEADTGVLAMPEDAHPASHLAMRAWQRWRERGSSSAAIENLDLDVVDDYVRQQSLDPYFLDFLDFVYEQRILFGVVSQRLDRIIELILRRNGIERVSVFANRLEVEPFTLRLGFPYYNILGCDLCPSCTLHHLRRFRRPGVPLIFVAEKAADVCPAREADLIFARGALLEACRAEGLACEPFGSLRDVERILTRLIMKDELAGLPRRDPGAPDPPRGGGCSGYHREGGGDGPPAGGGPSPPRDAAGARQDGRGSRNLWCPPAPPAVRR